MPSPAAGTQFRGGATKREVLRELMHATRRNYGLASTVRAFNVPRDSVSTCREEETEKKKKKRGRTKPFLFCRLFVSFSFFLSRRTRGHFFASTETIPKWNLKRHRSSSTFPGTFSGEVFGQSRLFTLRWTQPPSGFEQRRDWIKIDDLRSFVRSSAPNGYRLFNRGLLPASERQRSSPLKFTTLDEFPGFLRVL